jgi:type I restriction enzyme, S subunit
MKAEWKIKNLNDVCERVTVGHVGITSPHYRDHGILFLRTQNVGVNGLILDDLKYITPEFHASQKKSSVRVGDVLMSRVITHTVHCAVITPELEGANCANVILVRPSKDLSPEFLAHYIRSSDAQKHLLDRKTGSAQLVVNTKVIQSWPIPVPPLSDQQRIVTLLDEAFDAIAIAKANAEKNLQNAKAIFESHLQDAFTEQGEGFEETTLGEVCNFVGGSQPPKSVFMQNKTADNIRLIQIRDYKSEKHLVYIPRSLARRFCDVNDVMIGRYGPPLFQILRGLEGAYNVALMKAVPDEKRLTRDYLFYFLKHSAILEYVIYHSSRAAGQIGLTKDTLEPYPIFLPALDKQLELVERTMELEVEVQRLESIYQQKLTTLDELKKSLLHRAFNGDL